MSARDQRKAMVKKIAMYERMEKKLKAKRRQALLILKGMKKNG